MGQEDLLANRQRVAIYSIYSVTRRSPLPKIAGVPIILGCFLKFIEHEKGRAGLRVTTEKGGMEESKRVRERVPEPGSALSLHVYNGTGISPASAMLRILPSPVPVPYQGTDNQQVEEKNNSVIRTFGGYGRHDTQGKIDLLNRLYLALHLMVNCFLPSQKLLRGKEPGATSPRCTTWHRSRAPGCWHERMLQNRRRNTCEQHAQRWT
jgi:hypothetical protein